MVFGLVFFLVNTILSEKKNLYIWSSPSRQVGLHWDVAMSSDSL